MEKDVYAVLQLEAEEKEMQKSEAQVRLLSEQTTQAPAGLPSDGLRLPNVPTAPGVCRPWLPAVAVFCVIRCGFHPSAVPTDQHSTAAPGEREGGPKP